MINRLFLWLVLFCGFFFVSQEASSQVKVIQGEFLYRPTISDFNLQSKSEIQLYRSGGLGILSEQQKVVDFDPNDSTCADLILSGQATFCEPNFYVETYATSNDPSIAELYGLSLMGAPQAWNYSTGRSDVVVAVIDTGIDYRHPDLASNVWTNPGEIPSNGIDDDGNGWVDDVFGINAATGSGDPLDDNGHGTHVSGTIGASGNNGLGVVGVNWNVKVMGLKFLTAGGGGSILGAIKAIDYMIDAKNRYGLNLKVANNSWGGPGYSKALEDAINRAHVAGIIFVAAAGNEANNNDILPSYPANYNVPNVVSVAAIDSSKSLAFFSNYGANVDIAAAGVSILSTLPNGGYGKLSGTSMATPQVSGALALLAGYDLNLSASAIIERLYSTATPVSGLVGKIRTAAMLNLAGMLGATSNPISDPDANKKAVSRLSLRTSDGSSGITPGSTIKISVVARSDIPQIPLEMFLNNKKCEQATLVSLDTGVNKFRAKVGSIALGIKSLSLRVGEKKATKRIYNKRINRSIRIKKVSSKSFNAACSRISKSIR